MPRPRKAPPASAPLVPETSLVLIAAGDAGLTPAQKTFNRLVRRIERLRRDLVAENRRLDAMMEDYSTTIHPLLLMVAAQRQQFLRLLNGLLSHPALKRGSLRQSVRDLISRHLNDLIVELDGTLPEEFERLFVEVEGCTREEFDRRQFMEMRDAMEREFSMMGIQVDLSDLTPESGPEDAFRKLGEFAQRVAGQVGGSGGQPPRPKTKRQLAQEEKQRLMEEMRSKDLATLYKQLAKILHPDLEQDPERRAEKEAAMKELNSAYQKEDLHGLLRLEMEWAQREVADVLRLTDQKLKIYNEVLKEQVVELQMSVETAWKHPRFRPLARFGHPHFGLRFLKSKDLLQQTQGLLQSLRSEVAVLRGPGAFSAVRTLVR